MQSRFLINFLPSEEVLEVTLLTKPYATKMVITRKLTLMYVELIYAEIKVQKNFFRRK